jgi:predicted metal-dependent peptidase
MDDEEKAAVLAHELAHLLRGDCVRLKMKEIDPFKWNIAADACINESKADPLLKLERRLTSQLDRPISFVFKDRLIEKGMLPEEFSEKEPGTQEIYDNLTDPKNQEGVPDSLSVDEDMTPAEAMREHTKAALDAKKIIKELEKAGIDTGLDGLGYSKVGGSGGREFAPVEPLGVYEIDPLLKELGRVRGQRRRSFRREGRVSCTPRMLPAKNKKLAIYVDISGSMNHIGRVAKAVALYLDKYDVKWYLFGTKVTEIAGSHMIPTGGYCDGTDFDCIFDNVPTDRQVVVITDGECHLGNPGRVPADTVWAVIGGRQYRLPGHVVNVGVKEV